MQTVFIIISTVLVLTCAIPYIIDILRQRTKPRVVSWFTWALLAFIAGFASLSDNQYASAILSFSSAIECTIICVLALVYQGERSFARFDLICQAVAIAGMILWFLFNSPAFAIIAGLGVDLVAGLPTWKHAWEKPREETWLTYLMGGTAAMFTLLAATTFSITAVATPIFNALTNFTILVLIMLGIKRANSTASRSV